MAPSPCLPGPRERRLLTVLSPGRSSLSGHLEYYIVVRSESSKLELKSSLRENYAAIIMFVMIEIVELCREASKKSSKAAKACFAY